MIKSNRLPLPKILRFRQRGVTLVELMISMGLLFLIMVMGTTIFSNIQGHLKLAEQEARMQQYARDAINKMTRELRQASAMQMVPSALYSGRSIDLFFTRPHVAPDGTSTGFDLVRYWFADDYERPGTGIKSLYRAWKSNGTSTTVSTTAFEDNRTRMIREAAAEHPGIDSYFERKGATSPFTLELVLRVTVYRQRSDGVYVGDRERKFDMRSEIQYRNQ